MQVIIPMAGAGMSFIRAGYREPKPLIPVDRRTMIEHAIGMFPGVTDFVFVCSSVHLRETRLEAVLRNAAPTARIVAIGQHDLGPVFSTLQAEELIQDSEPAIVSYCDFTADWDFPEFCRTVAKMGCHGAVTAYRGFHPHRAEGKLNTYLRHRNHRLLEIRDRGCFTQDPLGEYVAAGTYYFQSGALLKHYFRKAMALGLSMQGEYYASMPCNLMAQDGLCLHVDELSHFAEWGTPEDLETYKGWSEIFGRFSDWRPARPIARATLIPMTEEHALAAGEQYREPKPLMPVAGELAIERTVRTLPQSLQTIALCRAEHLKTTPLSGVLRAARPGIRTISLGQRIDGQSCIRVMPEAMLDSRQPVLVAPHDSASVYDEYEFAALAAHADCVVFTFRNHAGANRNPGGYGWVSIGEGGEVERMIRNAAPEGDPRSAPGITGLFWFREAGVMFDAAALWTDSGRGGDDFSLDAALEGLIASGYSVKAFDVTHFISFRTPEDIRTYEYWDAWFRRDSHSRRMADVRQLPESAAGARAVTVEAPTATAAG